MTLKNTRRMKRSVTTSNDERRKAVALELNGNENGRRFKIMRTSLRGELVVRFCPSSVSFSTVAPHEARAIKNHGQTLERLNQRGGLDPLELVSVLENRPLWGPEALELSEEDAVSRLLELLGPAELLSEDIAAGTVSILDLRHTLAHVRHTMMARDPKGRPEGRKR